MAVPLPSLQDWLGAQVHREDLVGTLARLEVTQIEIVRSLGFEPWLAGLRDRLVMASVVEQARAEYVRCCEQLATTGHSESWPLWLHHEPSEEERSARWARHRAEAHITFDAFHHELHKVLRTRVDRVRRLYLDTCYWVRLRDVVLGRAVDSVYVELLAQLRELKAADRILCPFSYPIYRQLTKQTDDRTRRAMAEVMDELSEGICINRRTKSKR